MHLTYTGARRLTPAACHGTGYAFKPTTITILLEHNISGVAVVNVQVVFSYCLRLLAYIAL